MFEPQYLDRWTMPRYYVGDEWSEYYGAGVGQHRDSDCLSRANFDAMAAALDIDNRDDVHIVRENHWAVGWVEWIAIHESETDCLEIADGIKEALSDYPVIDESLWSEYEYAEACEVWEHCLDLLDRMNLCKQANISIFAARRDEMPADIEYSQLVD